MLMALAPCNWARRTYWWASMARVSVYRGTWQSKTRLTWNASIVWQHSPLLTGQGRALQEEALRYPKLLLILLGLQSCWKNIQEQRLMFTLKSQTQMPELELLPSRQLLLLWQMPE